MKWEWCKKIRSRTEEVYAASKKHIWRIALITTIILGVFLIGRPLYSLIKTRIEISNLTDEKARYMESIRRDSLHIENLKNDEFLEQYAREKFFMQGKNEQVFIVD